MFPNKKPKKEIQDFRKGILSHHKPKESRTDRAEFPLAVVKEAIERSKGICEFCRQIRCATTHHVMPRGRDGRGVITNAYRMCGNCHIEVEANEERKQEIIELYRLKFGEHFYFDETDWQEFERKNTMEKDKELELRQRAERVEPVVNLLQVVGRKVKAPELRTLENMHEKELNLMVNFLTVAVGAARVPDIDFGYGIRFED